MRNAQKPQSFKALVTTLLIYSNIQSTSFVHATHFWFSIHEVSINATKSKNEYNKWTGWLV